MAAPPTGSGQAPEPSDPGPTEWSADDEQALFGAHTPAWIEGIAPEAGASWSESEDPPAADSGYQMPPEASPQDDDQQTTAPRPSESPAAPPIQVSTDLTAAVAGEEITSVLLAAEQAARRIVERAQESAQAQMAEVVRRRKELEDEAGRLAAWREQVGSALRPMATEIQEFRVLLEEVPQRLSQAFALLAEQVPSIQEDLAGLAAALGSPPFVPANDSPGEPGRLAS
jgi:vacuolar-type H+-ATPase subunit H